MDSRKQVIVCGMDIGEEWYALLEGMRDGSNRSVRGMVSKAMRSVEGVALYEQFLKDYPYASNSEAGRHVVRTMFGLPEYVSVAKQNKARGYATDLMVHIGELEGAQLVAVAKDLGKKPEQVVTALVKAGIKKMFERKATEPITE